MNKVKVQESKIHGLGLFADQEFNEGDMIGLAHYNGVPSEIIGKYHNHSDNPNAHSVVIGNKRYLAALRPLRKGEEITVDYRQQPDLEQPEEFRKGGLVSMPKPSKKGLASKRYSRDLTATNRLLTKNKLLQKPKSKKNKIYDPNAKYYQTGGTSDPKNNFYTVQGSDGVYRKVGNTWEVDWNRSGNFQPLSKGDVAKRTAVLNSQAKPLYDSTYDDIYTTRQSAYTEKPKAAPVKNVTPQDKAVQEKFDKAFAVTGKSNMEVVEDKIQKGIDDYAKYHQEQTGKPLTQEEYNDAYRDIYNRAYVNAGVYKPTMSGPTINPYSMKQAGPAEKPQEFWDKAGDIISNPMTSAGFLIRGQAIPDYMQRNMDRGTFGYYANGQFHTERNPLDLAVADATGLSLVNDARNVYKGIENRDVAQAGLGALGFIPGVTELKNAGKAIKFAGPMKHTYQDVPEVLNALRQRGQYWDNTGAVGKDLLHPDMINYHGTYSGRPLVEVRMPDGSSEMFYKSSGWAKKAGEGVDGTTEGMWQVFGGHADTPKTSNWFIKDDNVVVPGLSYKDYYGSNTFKSMAENMDNALMQKLNFKTVDELDNAFNFKNRFGDVDSYTPKKQTGGTVELDGYRFKKDANGNWTYESGAPVTDRGMIQRLTYEAKPVGSPVVQSAPKGSLKPIPTRSENLKMVSDLSKSPRLEDQEKAAQLSELQREQDIFNPQEPDIIMKPKNMNDLKGYEFQVNRALGFPMDKAHFAAQAAAGDVNEEVDNFRHPLAGRYVAEGIANATGNIPYISPALGFIGSNLLGAGHEFMTLINHGKDNRSMLTRLAESGEDLYNNYVGAKVGASDMTPEEKTNYLLYLSYNNKLPDGIVSEGKPKKGTSNNVYFKKGPNDPGKYKSSYQDGGPKKKKVRFQPGTYDPNEMAGYMKEEDDVTVSAQASPWGKARIAYQERNPEEEFIEKKKRQYIRQSNKGLNKLFGINTENFNPDVEQNFRDEYDYLTNTAAVREVARQEGWNPNKRKEYVNDLNETQRQIVANSKYGSKLQPNYWDRALAGVATLVSPFSSGVQRMMNEGYMPGLTKDESQAILNSEIFGVPMGGAEIFTPLTLQGQALANYAKNRGLSTGSDYKELPAIGSGESMANVDDTDVMALDLPSLIELGFAPQAGVKLMQGLYKGAKQLPGALDNFSMFPKQPVPLEGYDLTKGQATKSLLPELVEEPRVISNATQQVQEPWKMQPMSGLHLKSTMTDGPISKIVEPKTGLVNVDQALKIISKESGGEEKVAMIQQALGENLPKKMDYNQFRKVVQDQLIPLDKTIVSGGEYGVDRIGYELGSPEIKTQKIILSNKDKFGRGSDAHGNPEETLGHVHMLYDEEEPGAAIVTQIQADPFQGTHRSSMKTKEQVEFSLKGMEEHYERMKDVYENIIKLPDGSYQLPNGQRISESLYKNVFSGQKEAIDLTRAELKNFGQKQLLDKNHQERYLQEIIQYAAERGDINRIKLPTAETSAKIQGYFKQPVGDQDLMKKLRGDIVDAVDSGSAEDIRLAEEAYAKVYADATKNGKLDYSPEQKTILKKYSENPKIIKKLYGIEPKIVTDSKGNTWYEFNIPYEFKEGPSEIKAFNYGGVSSKLNKFIR